MYGVLYFLGYSQRRKNETKKINAIESSFYLSGICVGLGIGEYMTRNAIWRSDYDECYRDYLTVEIPWELKFYYTYSLGFLIYCLISVFFLEARKKDFIAMVLHHFVTAALIILSGMNFMHKIGTIIMLGFDICDVFLESAKICDKIGSSTGAAVFFVAFVGVWCRNRIFLYFFHVLPSTFKAQTIAGQDIPYYYICECFLIVIGLLQVYWSVFIFKKAAVIISKGAIAGDPREEGKKDE